MVYYSFCCMRRRPPRTTLTDSLFPDTTLLRSAATLVIPATVARMLTSSFSRMLWLATAIGTSTGFLGMNLSYHLDIQSGPTIVLIGASMRSDEHTSELQSLMRISYAVFCLKQNTKNNHTPHHPTTHIQTH